MKTLQEKAASADEYFERGEYSDAELQYYEALQQETMPSMGLVENWIMARGQASLARARSLVLKRPDSVALHRLCVLTLLKESEYAAASNAATRAISIFGSDPKLATSFRQQRLLALVEGSRLAEPSWELILEDAQYLWSAYATVHRKDRLYAGIVERLLRLRGAGAPDALLSIADELDHAHSRFAGVLRSHAATLRLYSAASP